jgi:hypothetical protein
VTLAFSGRVEALITVPTGGAAVSASNGAQSAATTVTVPAGNYYLTAAGGVSSLLTTLQTQLNNNVQGYPTTAAALQAAMGFGSALTAGYLCNEASGNLASSFGAPATLTAGGTPTYGIAGPAGGIDKAVNFAASPSTSNFDGGANFDVNGATDLVVAWVGRWTGAFNASTTSISKIAGAFTSGWALTSNGGAQAFRFIAQVSAGAAFTSDCGFLVGEWHVGIAIISRADNALRIGIIGLTSGTSSIGAAVAVGASNFTTAATFRLGKAAALDGEPALDLAAVYIGTGAGIATGISAGMSTALSNLRGAINASWSVALSTSTGLIAASNSFWPSYCQFTNTTLRDVLGFAYDFDYPQTAAQMAIATGGNGTWTAGYLCNESSGNLASAFGTPTTLTAAGSPSYSNQGARGGADKAVGYTINTDYFSGGDVFDVGSGADLAICWVGRFSAVAAGFGSLMGKANAATDGWSVTLDATPQIRFFVGTGAGFQSCILAGSAPFFAGEHHVGMIVLDRSTNRMRMAIRGLTSNTTQITAETVVASVDVSAMNFKLGATDYLFDATSIKYSAVYVASGVGACTGMSANLSTALSNFATYLKSQTGTAQARGLWFPDAPLNADDHPSMAPEETDLRVTESPDGNQIGLSGNVKYVHQNVRWERSPVDRIRESSATYANASLEVFFRDAISGLGGHSWFTPCSDMQIYWSNAGTDTLLGSDANSGVGTEGWKLSGISKFSELARPSQEGWVGQFDVRFPRLVSDG